MVLSCSVGHHSSSLCQATWLLPFHPAQVFDAEANGSHKFIGSWQGSLTALQDASQQGRGLPLVNPTKAKPGYVSSGERCLAPTRAPTVLLHACLGPPWAR